MGVLLFRGLPATGGIQDFRARQVIDGIIENLRRANLAITASGLVYSGDEEPVLQPEHSETPSSLTQGGGGARVGVSFAGHALRLRTLRGFGDVTVREEGDAVIVSAAGSGGDTFKVKVNGGDTEGYLVAKLQNTATGDASLLSYAHPDLPNTACVKRLKQGTNVTFAVTDDYIEIRAAAGAPTGSLPIEVTDYEVGFNIHDLDPEVHAEDCCEYIVWYTGIGFRKIELGDIAGLKTSAGAEWKIPVHTGSGVAWKTITELLAGAVTTTQDPVAGDTPLTRDSGGALFWANSAECST